MGQTQELGKVQRQTGEKLDFEKFPLGSKLYFYPYHVSGTKSIPSLVKSYSYMHSSQCKFAKLFESRREKNWSSGFPTRSNTNRPVESQKQARSLKFRI